MPLASVDLPKLHLSDNGQQLELSLEGSLQLQFPDGVKLPQTSTELLKSVAEEHLWIARTGSCYFHVIVSIQGECVTAIDQTAELTEWIQCCEVWTKAGIRLQDRERGIDEPLGKMSFSIQHPDLSSTLVAPKDASTADFQSVICYIDITPAKPPLKRKRTKTTEASSDIFLNGQRVIEFFPPNTHKETQKLSQSGKILRTEPIKQLRQILDVVLELIVLGSRKQYKGITTNKYTRAECLTQLAPAVFSMQYLKTIYDRVSLSPTIATSLARMKNAESPSLRYKTAIFAARVVGENCDHGDHVIRGIEKGTWDVLLSSVKIPTRSYQARREVKKPTSNAEIQPEAILCEPNIISSAIQMERKDSVGPTQIPMDECSQVEGYEMREALFQQFQQEIPMFFDSQQCSVTEMEATNPVLFPGSHGGYLETVANCSLDVPEMKPMHELDYTTTPDSISPYCTMNRGIIPLDVQPLTTFNEWLCLGEFTIGYTDVGCSRETMISSGYDDDVSFYKSYE
ncbi:hypothetical protein GGI43DRAFT_190506 [Trichoderma evansii]